MKHFIIILILFVGVLSASADLQAQQAAFDRANTLLEEQEYSEAIERYKSIYEEGYVSGALWLNIGVAYTQLDSLGKAKYYILRASEFSETEEIAKQSLEVVENRFSRRSAVLPMLPWDRFFNFLDNSLGIAGLMVIGLLFLNVTAALLLASWFRPEMKTLFNKLSIVTIILTVLFIFFSVFLSLQEDWYETGVTIADQATVYNQPDTDSAVVSTAYEGYTMRVYVEESANVAGDNWFYVRLANGLYGWVNREAVLSY